MIVAGRFFRVRMGMAPNMYIRICFALLYVYVNIIRVQS